MSRLAASRQEELEWSFGKMFVRGLVRTFGNFVPESSCKLLTELAESNLVGPG